MKYACLFLPFPPTTNNLFTTGRGHGKRVPSKAYQAWREEAGFALMKQRPLPSISGPISLTFTFGRPDKRTRDVTNLIKAPEDLIVAHGIIEDDGLVERVTAQWCKDVIGVRVEIESMADEVAA